MYLIKDALNLASFQVNPSQIDVTNKEMIVAHCTVPTCMTSSFTLTTHFESKIGIAIKGKFKEKEKITLIKLSPLLDKIVILEGYIVSNLSSDKLCRTQLKLKINDEYDLNYFLTKPLGNHHILALDTLDISNKEKLISYIKEKNYKIDII